MGTVNKRGKLLRCENCFFGLRILGCFKSIGMYSLSDEFLWREREASGWNPKHSLQTFTELMWWRWYTEVDVQGNRGQVQYTTYSADRRPRAARRPLLEPEAGPASVLELHPLDAGAGVALVTAEALHAAPLVRITHAAAAPVQLARERVCAFHIHIDFFCGRTRETVVKAPFRELRLKTQATPGQALWTLGPNC